MYVCICMPSNSTGLHERRCSESERREDVDMMICIPPRDASG